MRRNGFWIDCSFSCSQAAKSHAHSHMWCLCTARGWWSQVIRCWPTFKRPLRLCNRRPVSATASPRPTLSQMVVGELKAEGSPLLPSLPSPARRSPACLPACEPACEPAAEMTDVFATNLSDVDLHLFWRNATKLKDSVSDGTRHENTSWRRAENASWRRFFQLRYGLATVSPAGLDWKRETTPLWVVTPSIPPDPFPESDIALPRRRTRANQVAPPPRAQANGNLLSSVPTPVRLQIDLPSFQRPQQPSSSTSQAAPLFANFSSAGDDDAYAGALFIEPVIHLSDAQRMAPA